MADNPYAVYALDVPEASPAKRLSTRRILVWSTCVAAVVAVLIVQHFYPQARLLPASLGSILPMTLLAVFLGALACEYIDSSLGMGYGTTLTPILLLAGFKPLDVVPCVLLSEFLTGLAAGLMHHHDGNVDLLRDKQVRLTTLLLSALSAVGAIAAATLAMKVSSALLSGFICAIILAVGVITLATTHRRLRFRPSHIVVLGTVAAFNKGLSGGGYGPLVTSGQVVSGISPKQAVAITSLAESWTCLVGLIVFFCMSHGSLNWSLAIPLTLGAMLSVPIATLTVARLPENAMRAGVGIVTCLLGLVTLAKIFG